jgi:2-haloalkanoic acid dehalogenase type II
MPVSAGGELREPRPQAVLFDLLMAVMNSPAVWAAAAGHAGLGLSWRDDVTDRMRRANRYVPYETLVAEAAAGLGMPPSSVKSLQAEWRRMQPWPDAAAIAHLSLPYAFVTNCSAEAARDAAAHSGLSPQFTLSAEEAGWFKPRPQVYRAACLRIGSVPERTVFVAGAAYDAEGALGAGLRARLVRRRPVPDGLSAGILVGENLDDVTS